MQRSGSAVASLAPAAPWLDGSARTWAALVIGSIPGAVVALLAAAGWLDERVALALFVPSFVGLNAMHMAATWSRVYLAPGYARARAVERIVVPFALAAAVILAEAAGGALVLFALQYYVSIHHGAMQNYGLMRASQRSLGRSPSPLASRVAQAACLLPLLAALAYRAREVCAVYDDAPMPAPPGALVIVLAAGGALALAAFLAHELAARARGEAADLLGVGVVLVVTGVWVILIVAIEHPALPFFAIASGHYIQYLWVVGRAERPRAAALGALPPLLRERVHPARSTLGHLVFLAVLGAWGIAGVTVLVVVARALATSAGLRPAGAMDLAPWGAAMLAVNLHHYWLDHRIWRSPPRASA